MSIYIESGQASLAKFGEELCGDNVELLRTADSVVAVLADGLGSGVKANILSKMTAKIIATMFENGASLEEVVETIGNTLPVCQKRNLAYSTFTIIQIRDDGETYVVEFDNPAVFYLSGGSVKRLNSAGVEICGKKCYESRFRVKPGDLLVVVSDGVIHAGIGGVLNLGWQWENVAEYLERIARSEDYVEGICRWLLKASEQLYAGEPGDDATVMALQIRNPRRLTVAVGPPQNKADDLKLVRAIREESGKKVICGGTTSSIVAKALGEEILVNLEELNPEVPPTGSLKGVDLVTEGIITLGKTLEYIKKAKSPTEVPDVTNGAISLAKVLLESDQIKFMVGRAINPAHQNPGLPVNLALKMQVVKEITEILKNRGKQIQVEYY